MLQRYMGDSSADKDIILVGTGQAATVLGRLIRNSGHSIIQVLGRQEEAVLGLARELHAAPITNTKDISKEAHLCIVSITDTALYTLGDWFPRLSYPVVHTAGSVPMSVLSAVSDQYGVLYPLQSLRKNQTRIPEIPFLIEANNPATERLLAEFAGSMSAMVQHADESERRQLHLTAVFTQNFSNHLCTLAANYCSEHNLDFQVLLPLLRESVARLQWEHPDSLQTGPAIRHDEHTMEQHIQMLEGRQDMRSIYILLNQCIQQYYQKQTS